MCERKYLNKLQHLEKYLAKPLPMQNSSKSFPSVLKQCFSGNYKFIIVIRKPK